MPLLPSSKSSRDVWVEVLGDLQDEPNPLRAWHHYLSQHLATPFTARVRVAKPDQDLPLSSIVEVVRVSPLQPNDEHINVRISVGQRTELTTLFQLECLQESENSRLLQAWQQWFLRSKGM